MNKQQIKNILISIRTHQNETKVNNLLGKIDLMSDIKLQEFITQNNLDENNIRSFIVNKLNAQNVHNTNTHKLPINDMFTYGISNNCIHLHLPEDLHNMIKENGIKQTIDFVNIKLIDALNRLNDLKNNNFYKLKDINNIYMISPVLIKRELKFLESLDFTTNYYKNKDLTNKQFINENKEAILATKIFGIGKNIGTASISFDIVNSKEWKDKSNLILKQLENVQPQNTKKTNIEK